MKGGRFAKYCEPAHVYSVILSDVLGDPIDMIVSGPTYPDSSTCKEARKIAEKGVRTFPWTINQSMSAVDQADTSPRLLLY